MLKRIIASLLNDNEQRRKLTCLSVFECMTVLYGHEKESEMMVEANNCVHS